MVTMLSGVVNSNESPHCSVVGSCSIAMPVSSVLTFHYPSCFFPQVKAGMWTSAQYSPLWSWMFNLLVPHHQVGACDVTLCGGAGTSAVCIQMVNQTSPSWDFGTLSLIGWCHLQSYQIELKHFERISKENQTQRAQRGGLLPVESPELMLLSCRPDKPTTAWAAPCSSLRFLPSRSASAWISQDCFAPVSSGVTWRVWKHQSHSQVKGEHTGMHDEVKTCVQAEKQFDQRDEHFQTVIPFSRCCTPCVRSTNNKWFNLQCKSLQSSFSYSSVPRSETLSVIERPSCSSLKVFQTFHSFSAQHLLCLSGLYYWQTVN